MSALSLGLILSYLDFNSRRRASACRMGRPERRRSVTKLPSIADDSGSPPTCALPPIVCAQAESERNDSTSLRVHCSLGLSLTCDHALALINKRISRHAKFRACL